MMKKILYFVALMVIAISWSSCHKEPEFVVKGTTTQSRLNGTRVFLVPYGSKQIEDSIGVDSVVIENNQFEFKGRGEYLARVTIDKHVRYGTQDLLIITESGGVINVVIDSVSSAAGTPQNEALQRWKDGKIEHDAVAWENMKRRNYLREIGDTVHANALSDSIRQYNQAFRDEMVGVAKILGSGIAHDLLMNMYGPKDTVQ